ncbi:LysR family transcriptional regulator [Planctobacterium marinum]|uniref:LysR family transcriptional regulator n=2 Tax=Planctobacterium marinum TaxID=1631968 RepID=A0AA48HSL6_9ALTE|nr:LysR family transcriptional regulator [Planctobacterium marinum]
MHFCMDWRDINFDWNKARAFYVTVQTGSLSAASQALALSQPTLSRQVKALEDELKVVLFERVGKGLKLTPSGMALYEQVKPMAQAAANLSLSAAGNDQELEGTVRISATEMTALFTLPVIIAEFKNLYPNIKIDTIVSNDSSDLKRREADIAIRAYRPEQPDLIIRKLKDMSFNLFASNQYIKTHQALFDEDRLNEADFVGFADDQEYISILQQYFGLELSPANFSTYTTNHMLNWQLVKQHMGISGMLSEVGNHDPDVSRVFPEDKAISVEMYLVSHRELRMNRRIKIVFDFLVQKFG